MPTVASPVALGGNALLAACCMWRACGRARGLLDHRTTMPAGRALRSLVWCVVAMIVPSGGPWLMPYSMRPRHCAARVRVRVRASLSCEPCACPVSFCELFRVCVPLSGFSSGALGFRVCLWLSVHVLRDSAWLLVLVSVCVVVTQRPVGHTCALRLRVCTVWRLSVPYFV